MPTGSASNNACEIDSNSVPYWCLIASRSAFVGTIMRYIIAHHCNPRAWVRTWVGNLLSSDICRGVNTLHAQMWSDSCERTRQPRPIFCRWDRNCNTTDGLRRLAERRGGQAVRRKEFLALSPSFHRMCRARVSCGEHTSPAVHRTRRLDALRRSRSDRGSARRTTLRRVRGARAAWSVPGAAPPR
jgi:hypothetical protein